MGAPDGPHDHGRPARHGTRLRALAEQMGTSAARLSRIETGQLRDGRIVDGYEATLGLPEGSLRAPIDVLCRTFPRTSPRDADPGSRVETCACCPCSPRHCRDPRP